MLKMFDQVVYVLVMKNALTILNVQENKQLHIQADQPFSTERLAVGHFNLAEETLKKGFTQVYSKSLFSPSPVVVMHQLYLAEGGLCEVEDRILRELALGAGGRQVYIWSGETLSREQLLSKVYASSV